jgi:hypothetical protein
VGIPNWLPGILRQHLRQEVNHKATQRTLQLLGLPINLQPPPTTGLRCSDPIPSRTACQAEGALTKPEGLEQMSSKAATRPGIRAFEGLPASGSEAHIEGISNSSGQEEASVTGQGNGGLCGDSNEPIPSCTPDTVAGASAWAEFGELHGRLIRAQHPQVT